MEDIETLLMQIISYSGDCKSSCIEALDLFKEEDYSQANSKLESAYNSLLKAKRFMPNFFQNLLIVAQCKSVCFWCMRKIK